MIVGEGKVLGLPLDQLQAAAEPGVGGDRGAGPAEHRRALVETDDAAAPAPDQRPRDEAGPAGDVEDAVLGRRPDGGDGRAAPARILAEAEQRAELVVVRRQPPEHVERVLLSLRAGCVHAVSVPDRGRALRFGGSASARRAAAASPVRRGDRGRPPG